MEDTFQKQRDVDVRTDPTVGSTKAAVRRGCSLKPGGSGPWEWRVYTPPNDTVIPSPWGWIKLHLEAHTEGPKDVQDSHHSKIQSRHRSTCQTRGDGKQTHQLLSDRDSG